MKPQESFVGQPIRSLQTMLRIIAEDNPMHQPVVPDGIYGPETMSAVTLFQRLHGLPPTGITDQITWEAIVAEYEPAQVRLEEAYALNIVMNPGQVLRKGERHPHLYLVQSMLTVLSEIYSSIPAPSITGLLDDATFDSLSAFQQLSSIPMTGHLDKHTWKHLTLQYTLAAVLQINSR